MRLPRIYRLTYQYMKIRALLQGPAIYRPIISGSANKREREETYHVCMGNACMGNKTGKNDLNLNGTERGAEMLACPRTGVRRVVPDNL